MKAKLLPLILLFLFASCKNEAPPDTFEIEDKDELIKRLADMYYMESFIGRTHKSEKDSVREKLSDEFYQLYKITPKELDEYLSNLKNDKVLFGSIMDSVSNLLNQKNAKKN